MDAHLLIAVLLIGAGIGLLSGAFGKGGSAVSTPLLHLVGVPALAAIASPLPATIPSTLLAGRSYAHEGQLDRRVLRLGLLVGMPAAALGALLTRWIPGGPLIVATDVLVLGLGLMMLTRSHDRPARPEHAGHLAVALAVVAAVGIISGLLGNSGGFLLAPLFVSALGMPLHRALGTSLILSAAIAVPGTIVHALLGHIDWSVTLAFGLAAVPLATVGARIALQVKERSLGLAYGAGLATLAAGLLVFAH